MSEFVDIKIIKREDGRKRKTKTQKQNKTKNQFSIKRKQRVLFRSFF